MLERPRRGSIVAGQVLYTITQTGSDSLSSSFGSFAGEWKRGSALTPILSWTASSGATSYNVYFGTSPTPPQVTDYHLTSYAPGSLDPGSHLLLDGGGEQRG